MIDSITEPSSKEIEANLKISIGTNKNKVILSFEQPITWIGLDPDLAIMLANTIINKAQECKNRKEKMI